MARPGNRKNMGKLLKPSSSVGLQSYDDSADIDGTGVDRTGYFGAMVVCKLGAASGSPSAQSITFKVEHSDDDTTYVDFAAADNGPNSDPVTAVLDADNELGKINLNLEVAKKYVRVVVDSANSSFTGGSSPANYVSADIVLCEKDEGLEA